ncbi:UNVERIFIED_ORG: hypothetical protein ABIC62_005712 [Burkholderia sp. 1595]|uniref:Uncharacterized protein n=1 Tax=Paraburkholderia terricola TaxID=169427 RepID=A0ABU1LZM3_9BURK|nr:hypothetical protein [Paraburkholderia terricola]MDR6412212.1 hypothetical protein [Paraburkholderia terricola]
MDESDALEFWNERAAIMQYDGGRSQPDAEYFAAVLMRRYAQRHGIEIRHHWLASITRGGAQWSDTEGKPVSNLAPYIPSQFRG